MSGWVKIHKKIIEWEWYQDHNTFRLFFYLILTANYKDTTWKGKVIKRGQKLCSLSSLSKGTGLTIRQIRTGIDHLKTTRELTVKTTNRNSIITICKYETYQIKEAPKRQAKRHARGQPNDKPSRKEGKEIKNKTNVCEFLKGIKKPKEEWFEFFWAKYPKKIDKKKSKDIFLKMPDELLIDLFKNLDKWTAAHIDTEKRYIPKCTTFLNGERWNDEIEIKEKETIQKPTIKELLKG